MKFNGTRLGFGCRRPLALPPTTIWKCSCGILLFLLAICVYMLHSTRWPPVNNCPAPPALEVSASQPQAESGARRVGVNSPSISNRKSNQSAFFNVFLGRPNDIMIQPGGMWSGKDTAAYHKLNHASGLSTHLVQFFKREGAQSVIDLGGGSGLYVQKFIANGIFASCYDGNPDTQDVSNGTCAVVDLTKPLNLAKHDWILSLSVGRQIPPSYEDAFVRNVDAVNRKGIVIYWGDGRPVVGKVEKSVRNNSQVIAKFEALGNYVYDEAATAPLKEPKNKTHSVLVFRKVGNSPSALRLSKNSVDLVLNFAVVSCGSSKFEESLAMIKSAILFSRHVRLRIFLFTDKETRPALLKQLEELHHHVNQAALNFEFEVRLVLSPDDNDVDGDGTTTFWEETCSFPSLFLSNIFPDVDSIIYAEPDTIFLTDLQDVWQEFKEMKGNQFMAAAAAPAAKFGENLDDQKPDFHGAGLDYGLVLLNLTRLRLRANGFAELISKEQRDEYGAKSEGQVLQEFLGNHPEFVKVLPCRWNLRRSHCTCKTPEQQQCGCDSALADGVALIHGSRNSCSQKLRLPLFRHVYELFKVYDFQSDSPLLLLEKLKRKFRTEENRCYFNSSKIFYKNFERFVQSLL